MDGYENSDMPEMPPFPPMDMDPAGGTNESALEASQVVRTMPNDRTAEEAVLGSMIMDREAVLTVSEILTKDDFYYERNGVLYEAMLELYGEGKEIDPVTLQSRLVSKSLPESYASVEFINSIVAAVPTTVNVKEYADIVKSRSMLRSIIKMNQKLETLCFKQEETVDALLDETEHELSDLVRMRGVSDETPIDKIVTKVLEKIQKASEQTGNVTGIPSGFTDLDYKTAGLQPSDLILIAARPSMGKTALALNIAEHVAIQEGLTTAIFSLEMSNDQIVNRILSLETGVEAQNLRSGTLKDTDWDAIMQGAGTIANSKLIIDDTPAITVSALRSKCRKYKNENDLQLVIIDYLQLMQSGRNIDSRQQEISEISRSLKALARELNVPVIALSQLNRGVEQREDKRPMLSDLRDSGAIEQDADVVMFIYRDDYYNHDSKDKGISEIIIAKQRNGPVGTVRLAWLPKYTRFADAEPRKSDKQENNF